MVLTARIRETIYVASVVNIQRFIVIIDFSVCDGVLYNYDVMLTKRSDLDQLTRKLG
jgi:hypothetical protein